METRPIIKPNLSSIDKTLELSGKILLFFMWGLTIFCFLKLPATIPIHYNASGKVNSYGNKMTLLLLPVLATIIYLGLTQLNKHPHLFNYLTKVTVETAQHQYSMATRMLQFLKLAILVIFSLIILFTYLTTVGIVHGLGVWFLPFTIGLLLIPTVATISESFKKKNNAS